MTLGLDDAEVAIAVAFLVMLFFVCITMRLFVCWLRLYFVVEVSPFLILLNQQILVYCKIVIKESYP